MPRVLTSIENQIARDLGRTAARRVTEDLALLISLTDYGEQDLLILAAAAGVVVGLTAGTLEQIARDRGEPLASDLAIASARALLGLHLTTEVTL
jgi:hypothetical protein